MQLQLSDGRTITITPPTGVKLVKAQAWFGLRFMHLRDHPPTEEAAQRRTVIKIAKALAPYVSGITQAELIAALLDDPRDMAPIATTALGALAYVSRRNR
jgi:hypothetical protein